jgi:hypothetical protein
MNSMHHDDRYSTHLLLGPSHWRIERSVATAQYPLSPATIWKCVVGSNRSYLSEGMESPHFRQVTLPFEVSQRLIGLRL